MNVFVARTNLDSNLLAWAKILYIRSMKSVSALALSPGETNIKIAVLVARQVAVYLGSGHTENCLFFARAADGGVDMKPWCFYHDDDHKERKMYAL